MRYVRSVGRDGGLCVGKQCGMCGRARRPTRVSSGRRALERVASSAGLSHARPSNGGEPCGFAMCPMLRSRSSLRERRKEDGRAPNARPAPSSSSRRNRVFATSAFSAVARDAFARARAKETLAMEFRKPQWARVSADAKRVLERMLHTDPRARVTAEALLEDEWFQED